MKERDPTGRATENEVRASLGRALAAWLGELGVRCEMVEVPGDEHLFPSRIGKGSEAVKAMASGRGFVFGN